MGGRVVACLFALGGCTFVLSPDDLSGGRSSGPALGASLGVPEGDAGSSSGTSGLDSGPDSGNDASSGGLGTYATTVLADKPLVYFRFEDEPPALSGDPQVFDELAQKKRGHRFGTLSSKPGAVGQSLQFGDGVLGFDNELAFPGRAAFSAELFVKRDNPDFAHLLTKQDRDKPETKEGWAIYLNGGGLNFERYVAGDGLSVSVDFPVVTPDFVHVCATYDGDTLRVFVDGELGGQKADVRPMKATVAPFLIATSADLRLADPFHGAIDEVAIYDNALSQARIQAHIAVRK